jgi:hypothetical protein
VATAERKRHSAGLGGRGAGDAGGGLGGGDKSEGCLRWDPLGIAQLGCLLVIIFLGGRVINSSEKAHLFGSLLGYLS